MASDTLRSRMPRDLPGPDSKAVNGFSVSAADPERNSGINYSKVVRFIRGTAFVLFFLMSTIIMHGTQFLGTPLYLINKGYYYSWMAMTKQGFGILLVTITEWFAPVVVRISGDESVAGQLKRKANGRLEIDFPERMVLIANHQIYNDWIYLWWTAYTARMHGHIYIILKESLKYVPVLGPGMQFFGFIFMARNWTKDQPRLRYRLQKLKQNYGGPMSGHAAFDPMWLLIFPEGTNLSKNGRAGSKKWAEKTGIEDMRHQVLPRSTGLLFCLKELKGSLDWVYDCTVHYEGIPRGEYGQDIYTLGSTYLRGQVPKSVNMYWRRYNISSLPLDDPKEFEIWLRDRWYEKDKLLDHFVENGRFPADTSGIIDVDASREQKQAKSSNDYIDTNIRQASPLEFLQMFVPMAAFFLVLNVFYKLYNMFVVTR